MSYELTTGHDVEFDEMIKLITQSRKNDAIKTKTTMGMNKNVTKDSH